MLKRPQGQKRKADVIGNAVLVMKIATGEAAEAPSKKAVRTAAGKRGGAARAAIGDIVNLTEAAEIQAAA